MGSPTQIKEFISIQKLAILKATEEGLEKGIKLEKLNIAKNLLNILDNETIALKTGLSTQEIASLRS